MNNTSLTFSAHDWRLTDRFAGFTLFDLHGEWLRGDWWTVTLAILGLRVTLTRWLVTYSVSGFPEGGGEPIADGQAFQFYEDNWPHNVPRESLGREHGA